MKEKGFMPAVILLVICVACTALLAITNEVTFEARAEQREIQANADRLPCLRLRHRSILLTQVTIVHLSF